MEKSIMTNILGSYTIAQRELNAINMFTDSIYEQFHIDKKDALKALNIFKKYKLIKIDKTIGQFKLTDGRVWDSNVINNAIIEYDLKLNLKI